MTDKRRSSRDADTRSVRKAPDTKSSAGSEVFEPLRTCVSERAERLLRITGAIARAVTPDEVYAALVDDVSAAVGASSGGLWLLDEETSKAKLVRSAGYPEAARQKWASVPLDAGPLIPAIEPFHSGTPLWIPSLRVLLDRYPTLFSSVTPTRAYRVSCLPLLSEGRTLGVLSLTIEEELQSSEEERNFLLLVATYASQAIVRLRILAAERESRARADAAARRLSVLSQASRAFMEAELDLDVRLKQVVRELGKALGSAAGITLLGSDGLLHTAAPYHPDPVAQAMLERMTSTPLRVGEGTTGSVAATGESVLVVFTNQEELLARAAPSYRAFVERYPTYSVVCAALKVRGRIIGAVTATRSSPHEAFDRDDLELLEELAARAAAAIDNSRLYAENAHARARAEQLYHFAQAVMEAERVEQVFEAALTTVQRALHTTRAAILMFDEAGELRFRAAHGLSVPYQRAVEGRSQWTRDTMAPEPFWVCDVREVESLASFRATLEGEGIYALAFVPLVASNQLVGKLMVYYPEPHAFEPHELETARAIANHLASVWLRFAATAKLEETVRYNELFAGVLAHDLRNPLSAIMTAAQLLLVRAAGETNERITKPVSHILMSGQRMRRMVEQLLDFTRARSGGGITIHRREANLADLCAEAVEELALAHPEWDIRPQILGDQQGVWDPDRLLQVISNLVANAGQHGKVGRSIEVTLDGTQPALVTFEVHNQGTVPPALMTDLFSPFRGTRHTRDQSRGLGLGLFIVREIVRGHGGRVDVSSSDEAGTRFVVQLPRTAALSLPHSP